MNLIKTALSVAVLSSIALGSSAFAANTGKTAGTVTFNGKIVSGSCYIQTDNDSKTVDFGTNTQADVYNASNSKSFSIALEECGSTADSVALKFAGQSGVTISNSLIETGVTKAGISLIDKNGDKNVLAASPYVTTTAQNDASGTVTYSFKSTLKGNGAAAPSEIGTGTFTKVLNFTITYP